MYLSRTTNLNQLDISFPKYSELRSKLSDVNFLLRKTWYCNFDSLKTSSAKVDEISQER